MTDSPNPAIAGIEAGREQSPGAAHVSADARKFYVHPRSREWAEGYIEAKGWRDVTLVNDYHVEPRRLELSPCAPTPVEHLKPIAALLGGAPDVG